MTLIPWILLGFFLGWGVPTVLSSRMRARRPALSSTNSVNVFDRTVFPAPHDARWRRVEARDAGFSGADVFVFGDRDIRLSAQALRVDGVLIAGNGQQTVAYFSDVQRCYYEFRQTLALQGVESAILNAGFGEDEERPAEATEPKKDMPSTEYLKALRRIEGRRHVPQLPTTSPVFRIDDTHVLPSPNAEGWKHWVGEADADYQSVSIEGGGHRVSVANNGNVLLDGDEWFSHKRAKQLFELVVERLPPKETKADRQAKAVAALLGSRA